MFKGGPSQGSPSTYISRLHPQTTWMRPSLDFLETFVPRLCHLVPIGTCHYNTSSSAFWGTLCPSYFSMSSICKLLGKLPLGINTDLQNPYLTGIAPFQEFNLTRHLGYSGLCLIWVWRYWDSFPLFNYVPFPYILKLGGDKVRGSVEDKRLGFPKGLVSRLF